MRKYRAREWSWKDAVTCVHMARFHLRQLGHKVEPMPRVRSLVAARRALAQRGWSDVADLLDGQAGLARIAPAMMWLGDLAVAPGSEGLGSIMVCAGPQKLIGWHESADGMAVLDIPFEQITASWRV